MIHRFLFIPILLGAIQTQAQNLIPNPSFEDTICVWPGYDDPFDFPYFSHVKDWFNPNNATPDYYVTTPYQSPGECASTSIYSPGLLEVGEWQYPHEGNRMLGLWCGNDLNSTRELLEAELLSPLIADTLYCFRMYASLGNWQDLAIDRLGASFSLDSVYDHSWAGGFNPASYVGNPSGNFLTDTAEWMLIDGIYEAQGGERFILIGNSFDDQQTTYLEVDGNTDNGWDVAYYFIDDLSLTACSQVGLEEDLSSFIHAFYSGLENQFVIESPIYLDWWLYDIRGGLLSNGQSSKGRIGIDASQFSPGVYLVHWQNGNSQGSLKLPKR